MSSNVQAVASSPLVSELFHVVLNCFFFPCPTEAHAARDAVSGWKIGSQCLTSKFGSYPIEIDGLVCTQGRVAGECRSVGTAAAVAWLR